MLPKEWFFSAFALACAMLLAYSPSLRAEEAKAEQAKKETEVVVCPICYHIHPKTDNYVEKAGGTLARGAANTLLGWTEIIRQPAEFAKGGRTVRNMLKGLAAGAKNSLTRTAEGVGELLTFWTPKVNDKYIYFAKDCPICMGRKKKTSK